MNAALHGCPQEAVNRMKYATLVLSTLLTVLAVEPAAVKAEISQPRSEETTLLAQRHQDFRRGSFRHRRRLHPRRFKQFPNQHFRHHRFRKLPHQNFRRRTFRRFPGQIRHRPFHHRQFDRRFYPRFRRYPYFRGRYPRYSPYYYPSSLKIYIH